MAVLEVNGLKKINEMHGIQYGDEMLVQLAGLLRDMEEGARPYRLNGGEFALLWNSVGKDVFHETLRRMQVILSGTLDFSAAVGGYRLSEGEAPMLAYTRAEAEMFANKKAFYRHKESCRYRPEGDHILELARPGVLERMLADGNFLTYWQPKFKVADRSLCGVEVLIRLQKDGRIVPPDQFIPLLESLHRCHLLDFFAFKEACRHLRAWIDAGLTVVPVSTNFSRHTFVMPDFLEQLERIRTRYAIPLELLQVEITENADSREHERVQEMSRRLARNGYHLAIDDFGVAHANLATLAEVDFSVSAFPWPLRRKRPPRGSDASFQAISPQKNELRCPARPRVSVGRLPHLKAARSAMPVTAEKLAGSGAKGLSLPPKYAENAPLRPDVPAPADPPPSTDGVPALQPRRAYSASAGMASMASMTVSRGCVEQ